MNKTPQNFFHKELCDVLFVVWLCYYSFSEAMRITSGTLRYIFVFFKSISALFFLPLLLCAILFLYYGIEL